MSEFEPIPAEDAAATPVAVDPDAELLQPVEDDVAEQPVRRRRRWPMVVAGVLAFVLVFAGAFYFLGAPSQGQTTSENGQAVPPADPNSPLAISIPGCVCHSDDPTLVAEHKEYRMNQCAGCHAQGTPAMGVQ